MLILWMAISVSPYIGKNVNVSSQHHHWCSSRYMPSKICSSKSEFLRLSYDGLKPRSMGRWLCPSRLWYSPNISLSVWFRDLYCFHIEALHSDEEIDKLISHIKSKNMKVGVAIKPKTPSSALYPWISKIDMALVMVHPSFSHNY